MVAFEPGDWIDALDGVGRVEFSVDVHVEEFHAEWEGHKDREPEDGGKKLGDPLLTMVIYKMLCKFNGKLRKRDLLQSCNASLCGPIDAESRAVIEKIQSEQPEAYKKFSDYREKKPFGSVVNLAQPVTPESAASVEQSLKATIEKLATPFTFDALHALARDEGLDLLADRGKAIDRAAPDLVLTVQLFNDLFKVRGKRALFTEIEILPPRKLI